MVAGDGVNHLGALVEAAREVGADIGVAAFYLVVDRLADIVEEAAALGQLHVEAELGGDHAGKERDLNASA